DGRLAAENQFGLVGAVSGYRHHDVVDDTGLQQAADGAFNQRASVQLKERLGHTGGQPFAQPGGRDHRDRARHSGPCASGIQDAAARTSSRMVSALASSVLSASASSPTRIWRALASMRFSPADRPRSWSRRHRSRTTSATLLTSPEASFSRLALYRL